MCSFYYDVLKMKYGNDIRLIYTDTDSYVIQTFTDDIYEDWKAINEHMDFCVYDKKHPCYDPVNKEVLGKFKDECDVVFLLKRAWRRDETQHFVEKAGRQSSGGYFV